jgi:sRNA-binding protein
MKINNVFILLLCISLFAACKPKEQVKEVVATEVSSTIYKVGDKIQVLWGNSYYPSSVIEIGSNDKAGKYKINYDGWSSNSDEWVGTDRIRSADIQDGKVVAARKTASSTTTTNSSATTETATTTSTKTYKVGDKIQVLWGSKYYPSSVIEIGSNDKAGKYKINYDGWSSSSDEWVGTDRIK